MHRQTLPILSHARLRLRSLTLPCVLFLVATVSYFPEIGNVISSIVIIWAGFHMLYFFRTESQMITLIAAGFVVNGWSALGSHATGAPIPAVIDRWSMLSVAWIACGFMIDEFTESLFLRRGFCTDAIIAPRAAERPNAAADFPRKRLVVRGLGWTLCLSATWIVIGVDWQVHDQTLHVAMTAAPVLLAVILGGVIIYFTSRQGRNVGNWQYAAKRFKIGVALGVVAVACEIFTMNFCDTSDFFKIFPGHALWHVCLSLALINFLVYASMLRLDNMYGTHPYFYDAFPTHKDDDSCCCYCWGARGWSIYFAIVPGFEFRYGTSASGGGCRANPHPQPSLFTLTLTLNQVQPVCL